MNYFKIIATGVFAVIAIATAASTGFSAEDEGLDILPEVQIDEGSSIKTDVLERTDWYYETERGSYVVSTQYGKLETIIHPTLIDFAPTENISPAIENVHANSPLAEKLIPPIAIESFDAITFQVNKSYDIPKEFYYEVLPEGMHCLVEGICNLEQTQEISSMFLFAVAATEVGWDGEFAGDNNWFNWTPDAENYQGFATTEDCITYTGKRFRECYFNPEWYAEFGQTVDDYFTIADINSRYAFYDDCSVNWYWGEVVSEILDSLNTKYTRWVAENYG